jgi:hypothetical protein
MSPRIMKSLAIFTAAAGVLSAAALTASVLPASASASASAEVTLYGASDSNQDVICTPPGAHGVEEDILFGVDAVRNGCGTRVWLHQFSNGSGWSYCVSPHDYATLPDSAQFPAQLLVSENSAAC